MKTVEKPCRCVAVHWVCPECEEGLMKPTGKTAGLLQQWYVHQCDNCEHEDRRGHKFPKMKFQETERREEDEGLYYLVASDAEKGMVFYNCTDLDGRVIITLRRHTSAAWKSRQSAEAARDILNKKQNREWTIIRII